MERNKEYYFRRIIEILTECRKRNHKSVLEVCVNAGFETRAAYYRVFTGNCDCLTTLICLGIGADIPDYYWPEYFACCLKWLE